jgi:hypothetical protein
MARQKPFLKLGLISLLVGLSISCSTTLYKVKPVVELPALPADAKSASGGGVSVRVAPLLSDEESQDLFEANLPLAGILPVRMELAFESGVPVEIKKARFHLREGSGREWKLVSPKSAISRIMKSNDIYAYNPNSKKQFEKEFGAYALDVKSPLSDSDRQHRGFLFFQTPDKGPVESPRGLVLNVEKLPQPVTIQIN